MADKKISALPAATTPLAGTEVLPVVQGGTTDKVSVANLTAGRAVSALSYSTTAGYQFRGAENTGYELLRVIDGTVNPGLFLKARAATKDIYLFGSGSSVAGQRLMLGAEAVEDALRVSKDNITAAYGNVVIGTAGKGIDFSANTHAAGMTSELLDWYEEGTWTPTDASGAGLSFTSASGRYTRMGNVVFLFGFVQYPVTASANNASIGGLPFTANSDASTTQGAVTYSQVANVRSIGVQPSTTNAAIYTLAGGVATNANMSNTSLYFSATYFV